MLRENMGPPWGLGPLQQNSFPNPLFLLHIDITRGSLGFPGVSGDISQNEDDSGSLPTPHTQISKISFFCLFSLPHWLVPNCPAHHWQHSFPCLPIRPCLLVAHSLPTVPHHHGNHMSWIFQDILISNILSCGQTMCQIICQKICPDLGFENIATIPIAPIAPQIWLLFILPFLANWKIVLLF